MPEDSNVGGIILQAAQGIANLAVRQQQLEIEKTNQLRQQQQAERTFAFKEQEFKIKERTIQLQEEQLQRSQRLDVLRQEELGLDIKIKGLKAKALAEGGPAKPLSPSEQLTRDKFILGEADKRMMGILAQNYNSRTGNNIPSLASEEAYFSAIKSAERSAQTSKELVRQLRLTKELSPGQSAEIDQRILAEERAQAEAQQLKKFTRTTEFQRATTSPEFRQAVETDILGKDQAPFQDLSRRLLEIRLTEKQLADQRSTAFGDTKPTTADDALTRARGGNFTEMERLTKAQLEGLPQGSQEWREKIRAISSFIDFHVTDPEEALSLRRQLVNSAVGTQP
jgi:hypothetical protein